MIQNMNETDNIDFACAAVSKKHSSSFCLCMFLYPEDALFAITGIRTQITRDSLLVNIP